jgi:hypothetical protein
MPIGSEKSYDAHSDNRHEEAKSDHNEVKHSHDARPSLVQHRPGV